jgi:hypothetical protein
MYMYAAMFANKSNQISVPAADYLFREGDEPDFLYSERLSRANRLIKDRDAA